MEIYHYSAITGQLHATGWADENPLDHENPLLLAYSTNVPPPQTGVGECARYITASGYAPANHADGEWIVQPDWRNARLWSIKDGQEVTITEPNVTPEQIGATSIPYPGPGYVWLDSQWQEDPALKYQLSEQAAERELVIHQAKATSEINRITPAVDGGYAKPADVELLPKWQRYLYELPDVRTNPGWPESPQWPTEPDKVI